jgi:hypothetical protein
LVAVGRRIVGFVLIRVADGVAFFVGTVAGLTGRDTLCVGFTVACTVTVGVTVTVGTTVAVTAGCVVAVAASELPDEPHPPTSATIANAPPPTFNPTRHNLKLLMVLPLHPHPRPPEAG